MGYLIDILIGAAGSLVAAELWSHSDPTARWLICKAVSRLPAKERERSREEWLADLHDMPGALRKLLWAVGCHWAATVANVHAQRMDQKLNKKYVIALTVSGALLGAGIDSIYEGHSLVGQCFIGAALGASCWATYLRWRYSRPL